MKQVKRYCLLIIPLVLAGCFEPVPITAPDSLQAIYTTMESIELSWSYGSDEADAFILEHSTDQLAFTPIAELLPDAEGYEFDGAQAEKDNFFRIKALAGKNESAYTGPVKALLNDPSSGFIVNDGAAATYSGIVTSLAEQTNNTSIYRAACLE